MALSPIRTLLSEVTDVGFVPKYLCIYPIAVSLDVDLLRWENKAEPLNDRETACRVKYTIRQVGKHQT
jgi:hypothetical protein